MLFSLVIFSSSVWKVLFNKKNLMIFLLSLEMLGVSCFVMILSESYNYMFFSLFFLCFMVSGSCIGLSLMVCLCLNISKNFVYSIKTILC